VASTATPDDAKGPTTSGRFKRNVLWQLVANGAQAVLGGAYLLALGRFLGPAAFGTFSVVMALVSVAGLLVDLRLQDVVARQFAHADDQGASGHDDGARALDLFVLEACTRLLPSLALVLLALPLARLSGLHDDAVPLIAIAAGGFFLSKLGWGVSTGMLRALGRTDAIALCLTADWGLRLGATVACFFLTGLTVELAVLLGLVAGGLGNLVQLGFAAREFQRRVAPLTLAGWHLAGARARLRDNRRLLTANLALSASDLMSKDVDVALISSILSADKVGVYKMAKAVVQSIWRAIDPFYLAIMPEVQKLYARGDHRALRAFLAKTSLRLLALSVLQACVGGVGATVVLERIVGPGFHEVPGLVWLMAGWVVVCGPLVWGHPLAVAINRPELAVVASLLGSFVGVATFLLLTPSLELIGAAVAWAATLIVNFSVVASLAAWSYARRSHHAQVPAAGASAPSETRA